MSYEAATYGDRIAAVYDTLIDPKVGAATEAAVAFLADIAADGNALELGIGTGRVALPLVERGVNVHGIDASEAMIARLRQKDADGRVKITVGDFAEVAVEGEFRLVYVVFNTFFALLTQEAQVDCFDRVSDRLSKDGAFVIEAFVPDPTLFDRGQRLSATYVDVERVQVDATQHDAATQRVTTQHVIVGKEGIMMLPVQLRYAWPSELDLMARLAGLTLAARYGGWQREPFTSTSPAHVSVYTKR